MIHEEPESLTDIRDFTALFYVSFRRSPANGQSHLARVTKPGKRFAIWSVDLAIRDLSFFRYYY